MTSSKTPPTQRERSLSLHFGSLEAIVAYLQKHQVQEVCLKSILSPTMALQGDSVRHSGVCVSACVSSKPETPIAYATFLAATGAWSGRHTRLLYPKLPSTDPLQARPMPEAIEHLQEALFSTLLQALQAVPSWSVVEDARWNIPDAWVGIAKGFAWQNGQWCAQTSSPASLFSIS
jgi:hypothetical protein